MNQAHLHLILNHIPLFAVAFGMLAWLLSMIRSSKEFKWSAVVLFGVAAFTAWIASETGEGAEDLVEKLPGVTKAIIHDHEEAAELASASTYVLAAGVIAHLFVERMKPAFGRVTRILVLLLSLASAAGMARAAYLGGMVRHTEIRGDSTTESVLDSLESEGSDGDHD